MFQIYKDKAGKHRFRLKAKNGENIISSQAYASRATCMKGIKSVAKHSNKKANSTAMVPTTTNQRINFTRATKNERPREIYIICQRNLHWGYVNAYYSKWQLEDAYIQ